MIKMMADASLANLQQFFSDHFQVTQYINDRDLREKLADHRLLVCRSTLKVDSDILTDSSIDCVATVSSGTDHIISDYSIKIIDAKGANARAVADYVITCVAYCQLEGYLSAQQVGIIGAGAVGTAVAVRLQNLGFNVKLYDPLRAMHDPDFFSCEWESLLDCDLVCVHANLHNDTAYPSRHLLNEAFFSQIKSGTVIINAARGDIVDEEALLNCSKTIHYCTDVYAKEPNINPELIDYATLCTPHIAGHSKEAKSYALNMVCQKIHAWYDQNFIEIANDSATVDLSLTSFTSWQSAVLAIYNPGMDTQLLKQSQNVSQKFLELRKEHDYRHDFNCYMGAECDSMLSVALGKKVTFTGNCHQL